MGHQRRRARELRVERHRVAEGASRRSSLKKLTMKTTLRHSEGFGIKRLDQKSRAISSLENVLHSLGALPALATDVCV
jgi:hypothetical protein